MRSSVRLMVGSVTVPSRPVVKDEPPPAGATGEGSGREGVAHGNTSVLQTECQLPPPLARLLWFPYDRARRPRLLIRFARDGIALHAVPLPVARLDSLDPTVQPLGAKFTGHLGPPYRRALVRAYEDRRGFPPRV